MLGFIWPKPFFFAWGRVNLCRLQVEHDALVREAHFQFKPAKVMRTGSLNVITMEITGA